MTTLSDIGEISLIKRLCAGLTSGKDVIEGPGDDCAIVRLDEESEFEILLTSDPVIENIHFTPETNAEDVGHKAVGRALSDIAAMGGAPLWCLINTTAPKETPVSRIDALFTGASALASEYGASIVGGDLSEGSALSIHVFAAGKVKRGSALLRSGAKNGDAIFVTGKLGNSIKQKHLSFEPRIKEGQYLIGKATSAIDVTDGLIVDLKRILDASSAGAKIDLDRIPVSEDALAANDGSTPLEHALTDGEDFELLFTVSTEAKDEIVSGWNKAGLAQCTEIGTITAEPGVMESMSDNSSIDISKLTGYLHFQQENIGD